jgi:hypothetical protein
LPEKGAAPGDFRRSPGPPHKKPEDRRSERWQFYYSKSEEERIVEIVPKDEWGTFFRQALRERGADISL